MGIRGLLRVLDRLGAIQKNSVDLFPSITTLLVDGDGFLHHILRLLESVPRFSRELGGEYDIFHECIVRELRPLLDARIHVVFFFDGDSQMKQATKAKRHRNKTEKWDHLYDLCQKSATSVAQVDLPVPPCSKSQLRWTLESLQIEIKDCIFEADQQMALYCSRLNSGLSSGREVCFIYGDDRYAHYLHLTLLVVIAKPLLTFLSATFWP